MKKSLLLILFVSLFTFANAKISVGEIIALDGKATIVRDNKNLNPKIGFELFKKDIIKTAKASKLQLLFNDNTSVSIGNSSTMKVSEYIFDDKKNSKVQLDFKTGVFKTITGKIGKLAPSKFKLKTKTSTIGIRGTKIIVFTGKAGDKISCTGGAINVRNLLGNVTVRKGFQTSVVKNKAPQKPRKYTKKDFQNMEKRFQIKKKKVKSTATGPMMLESTKKLSLSTTKEKPSQKSPALKEQKLTRTPSLDPKTQAMQPAKLNTPIKTERPKVNPVVNSSLNSDLKLLDNSLKTGSAIQPLSIPTKPVDSSISRTSSLQVGSTTKTLDSSVTSKLKTEAVPSKTLTPIVPTTNLKTITPVVPTKAVVAPTPVVKPIVPTTSLKPIAPTTTTKTITTK